jgi:hypothetical protein
MDKAIEDLDAHERGEELGYRKTARILGVAESTLRRSYQEKCSTHASVRYGGHQRIRGLLEGSGTVTWYARSCLR